MNTDKLFQEYFQIVPQALFELLKISPPCAYRYESPVVKSNERRMDGFLEPKVTGCAKFGRRQRSNLIDLLIKFVMQRFVNLPYQEIEQMLLC